MKKKLFNNYNVLFTLRTLKSVLTTFLDSFLVLYFLQLSNSNILPIGVYKLVAVIFIYLIIFFTRNICKSKYRINLLRIGIILNLIYFIAIIFLKEKVVNYIYLIGMLYGLEEGFYYSVFNMIETDGVSNSDRKKYIGAYTALKNILTIILPVVFGFVIKENGFANSLIIITLVVIVQIFLSYSYKDLNIPKKSKSDIKGFYKLFKQEKKLKEVFKLHLLAGLTYSEGAFTSIITIYIIKVFSDSFSLGVFTSIFSIISTIMGLCFIKIIKPKYYNPLIIVSTFLTIVSLVTMIINCNMITIVLFNLFQRISKGIVDLVNSKNVANIANDEKLQHEYKVEYFLSQETGLVIGRILSNGLFILMAFTDSNMILYLSMLFVILWTYSSIKLQKQVEDDTYESI